MTTSSSKTIRRGRPPRSKQQAEDSRQVIIAAARTLFVEEGYRGVSMRKIAALAQCSPAALYKLFPGKQQLLLYIWEEILVQLAERLEACQREASRLERLEAMTLAFIDFWLSRPDDYRAIFLIEDPLQAEGGGYFVESAVVQRCLGVFHEAIAEAQANGILGAGSPTEKLSVLLCGMQGLAMNLITIPEYPWGDPARLKQATVRALLAGLKQNECT